MLSFNAIVKKVEANSPTVLTALGVTGTVTTAYFTGRASFKAARIIDEHQKDADRYDPKRLNEKGELSTKEKLKLVWPLYIPPVVMGASTIGSIIMANQVASKKIAALAVASGISERAFQEYKAKVIEKLGENKDVAIRDEIAQDRINRNPPGNREVILAGTGQVLCFDMLTGRYFQSSMEDIKRSMNKVNADIINHDYASLASFHDEIGLPATPYTDNVGWNTANLPDLQFSTVLTPDGRPCLAIDFTVPPTAEYTVLY